MVLLPAMSTSVAFFETSAAICGVAGSVNQEEGGCCRLTAVSPSNSQGVARGVSALTSQYQYILQDELPLHMGLESERKLF